VSQPPPPPWVPIPPPGSSPPPGYGAFPGYGAPSPGPLPASSWPQAQPPRRRSRTGLVVAVLAMVLVLCCGGAGVGIWYRNSYAPRQQANAMRALFAKIGAPAAFGPKGRPSEVDSGAGIVAIDGTYVMHCPAGACPTSAAAAVVTWTTQAGSTEVTNDYLNKNCPTGACVTRFDRDGFHVQLTMQRGTDYDITPISQANILYEVSVRVGR
jgi:hypothetical protein